MAVPERDAKANLAQALHLLAGSTYTEKLHKEGNRIDHLLKNGDSNQAIIEELSLTGLSRRDWGNFRHRLSRRRRWRERNKQQFLWS